MFKNLISKLKREKNNTGKLFLNNNNNNPNYAKAFIHKSFENTDHNERLEFLGDSVLSLIITEILFHENKSKEEGFLSKKRSKIVSRKHLNMVGKKIIPEKQIQSALKTIPSNIFGNTLEAIVGAIYIEEGFKEAKKFVKKHIYKPEYFDSFKSKDFKSEILKISQKKGFSLDFIVHNTKGAEHKKQFTIDLYINQQQETRGEAGSIKEAEQIAAEKAINKLFLHK